MDLINQTVNQHYLSQVEQRLNSIRTRDGKETDEIYQFEVLDRENFKLSEPKKVKIAKTLSFNDLYTFAFDKPKRENLEKLFQDYEKRFQGHVAALEQLTREGRGNDAADVLLDVFCFKMLNFLRNPHCIEKTLNTIGSCADYKINEDAYGRAYEKIDCLDAAYCQRICNEFQVNEKQYKRWLKSLLFILYKLSDGSNYLESSMQDLFLDKKNLLGIFVFTIDDDSEAFLLSDRSFTDTGAKGDRLSLNFNIRHNLLISYSFIPSSFVDGVSIQNYMEKNKKFIQINIRQAPLEILSLMNRLAIYQAKRFVYCAKEKITF